MSLCIGVDVQINRPCSFVALDGRLRMICSGWLEGEDASEMLRQLDEDVEEHDLDLSHAHVGIDAPRVPLKRKRSHYWDRKKNAWRPRKESERGWGRHCEVIIRSCGIANPQWTPTLSASQPWMKLGYQLFHAFEEHGCTTHEVFPSASYAMLSGERTKQVSLDFSQFARGPKDMLDAAVAAFTVGEYLAGRGEAVGDDGLGTIILPRPLPDSTSGELLRWPAKS